MKKIIVLISIFFLQSGFMFIPSGKKITAIDQAFETGFEGINKETKFSIALPRRHDGRFAEVEQFDFVIESGEYKGLNASTILTRQHQENTWKILELDIQQSGTWTIVPRVVKAENE